MIDFYVSPQGTGDGSLTSPCSLEQAQLLVDIASKKIQSDINIHLLDGSYFRDYPIVIKSREASRNKYTICWRNAEGAKPVLTSGKDISNWSVHDEHRNIWKASVPRGSCFEHLWHGGQRLMRASSSWNPKGFYNVHNGGLHLKTGSPDVSQWGNLQEVIVTKRMMWRNILTKVDRVENGRILLNAEFAKNYKVPNTALGVMEPFSLFGLLNFIEPRKANFKIENAFELLTDEGEWYLDKKESVVYYKPLKNQNFNANSKLTYSQLDSFFMLDGYLDSPVKNITISGLRFEYSAGTRMGVTAGFPTEPTKYVTNERNSAIQVNAGHGITLENNIFLHMGYDAVHFDLQGSDIKIVGNAFGDVSRSAISLSQSNLKVSENSKKGIIPENKDKFFDGVLIANNYIRRTGIDTTCPAVTYTEFMRNLRFTHNHIRESSIQAIRGSWRYLGWRGHTGNIEYDWNRTSDVGQDGLVDFGALYVSCSNAGFTKIHHNFIDGVGKNLNNAGIYLDVFVDGAEINNNVSINMPSPKKTLMTRGWVVVVMSKNTKTYSNWSDSLFYKDFDQGRLRFLWPDRSNKKFDNHIFSQIKELPEEAREVAEKTGLEQAYKYLESAIDNALL